MLATAAMGGARKPPETKCEHKIVYWPRQLACATKGLSIQISIWGDFSHPIGGGLMGGIGA